MSGLGQALEGVYERTGLAGLALAADQQASSVARSIPGTLVLAVLATLLLAALLYQRYARRPKKGSYEARPRR